MRHRRFLVKKHRYRRSVMNQFFADEEESQGEAPAQTRWGPKVYEMLKDMDHIEFGKKKKKVPEEEGTKQTRKRKQDIKEDAAPPVVPVVPFKKKALFSFHRNPKSFQDSLPHRILWHMHEALNIDENKN